MSAQRDHPSRRFSDRVGFYLRARPRYPDALLPFLARELGLNPQWCIADIGSGTGFFSEPFLVNGNAVFAVEPNDAMRCAAEQRLAAKYPRFHSVNGTAEATGLSSASVDLVAAAQSFHWFDHALARREFARILKPDGWVALVWNNRRMDDEFSAEYQRIVLRHAIDHELIRRRHERAASPERLNAFFAGPARWQHGRLANSQTMDFAALRDRLLSSSYVPLDGDPRFAPMMRELKNLFARHQRDGSVRFEYDTDICFGRM